MSSIDPVDLTAKLVRCPSVTPADGGAQEVLEGNCPDRHVIIEFPDRATALAWYGSDAYRRILPLALNSSERDIVLVDGI